MKQPKSSKAKSQKTEDKSKSKTSNLERKPDGTIIFLLNLPKEEVARAYKNAVSQAVKITEINGFRKGKAPEHLVVDKVGKQKLYTDALRYLLPQAYSQALDQLNLTPISSPRIEPEKLIEDQDWQLKVTVAEKPRIELGDYKKAVSSALASSKIWLPGKDTSTTPLGEKPKGEQQPSTDEKLAKVFAALLDSIKLNLPQFLIEEEMNRQLSQLIQQLERLNLTVDQYLASLGKTSEQLRQEYQNQAERTLKLELILNEIAADLKVTVSEDEVNQLIKALGDEKLRESLNTPTERASLSASLRKRKVLDQLLRM